MIRRIAAAVLMASVLAAAVAAVPAQAASPPVAMPGVTVDGTVHAAVMVGDLLVIGGDFTVAGGRNLAAIDVTADLGFASIEWAVTVDEPVHALAAAPNGAVVYVGGEFGIVDGEVRAGIAAVSAQAGQVTAWNPGVYRDRVAGAVGVVRALARSADGLTLYVGGDFSEAGGAPRQNLASLGTVIPGGAAGGPTGGALPWSPAPDGPVRAVAVDEEAGRVYAGGAFGAIGDGDRAQRNGLAAVHIASAAALAWDVGLGAGARVDALALGDGLVAGGEFTVDGHANLAVFDAATGEASAWQASADAAVQALAMSPGGERLYVGGLFTQISGEARTRIAGFNLEGEGGVVMPWAPDVDAGVLALTVAPDGGRLFAGGAFGLVSGEDEAGIAAFAVAPPESVPDPPGGSFREPQTIRLACVDRSGAGCLRICYAESEASGEPPAPDELACETPDAEGRIERSFGGETTLHFFSEDADGNREALRTAVYAVDVVPPETAVSLAEGLYGRDTVRPVELTCEDDRLEEFGCTTYYTLDGSEPDTASTVYRGPVSLAGLFPDRSIPPGEVDPLRHLAGTVTLHFFSVDGAGNPEAPQRRVYDVDLAPPVVTASLPSGNHVAPIAVTLDCDDGLGSGCEALWYTVDGTVPGLDADGRPTGSTARWEAGDPPLTFDSAVILRTLAIDRAGNRAAALTASYALTAPEADVRSGVGAIDLVSLLLGGGLLLARRARKERPR